MLNNYENVVGFIKDVYDDCGLYKGAEQLLNVTKTFNSIYGYDNLEKLCRVESNLAQEIDKISIINQKFGAPKVSSKLQNTKEMYCAGIMVALKQYTNIECVKNIRQTLTLYNAHDFEMMGNVFHKVLGQVRVNQTITTKEIKEEIARQYIEEQVYENADLPKDKIQEKADCNTGHKIEIIMLVLTIIQLLISIYDVFFSQPQVVINTYNNTTEVNCYYTMEKGMDAEFLNDLGYGIINENNVMPRFKPNCSSMVMGHIHIGQVVYVSNKWKKWIEINWTDEDGNYCTGWIQNYKVTEFK